LTATPRSFDMSQDNLYYAIFIILLIVLAGGFSLQLFGCHQIISMNYIIII